MVGLLNAQFVKWLFSLFSDFVIQSQTMKRDTGSWGHVSLPVAPRGFKNEPG